MALAVETVTVDARDPLVVARFWAEALGWTVRPDEEDAGDLWVEPGPGQGAPGWVRALLFVRVPEAKSVKNRIHLDLRPDDRDAEVARLEALGATPTAVGQDGSEDWVVLADPEGNEFCVLSD